MNSVYFLIAPGRDRRSVIFYCRRTRPASRRALAAALPRMPEGELHCATCPWMEYCPQTPAPASLPLGE